MSQDSTNLIVFVGFLLIVFSKSIIRITLVSDNLIFFFIATIGLLISILYIINYKNKISRKIEYLYIFIRNSIGYGSIFVFLLLWLNYCLRNHKIITVKTPVISCFLDIEKSTDEYDRESIAKSVFIIKYKGQIKNIAWHEQLLHLKMNSVKAIEIKKSKGLFGIDIIEETNLIYN